MFADWRQEEILYDESSNMYSVLYLRGNFCVCSVTCADPPSVGWEFD